MVDAERLTQQAADIFAEQIEDKLQALIKGTKARAVIAVVLDEVMLPKMIMGSWDRNAADQEMTQKATTVWTGIVIDAVKDVIERFDRDMAGKGGT